MYICDKCGKLCEDDDLPTYEEDFGYDTGVGWRSAMQTFVDNCSCGGEFVEAKECEICGEWFDPDTLYDGICEECLKEATTEENAIKMGEECKESVEINGFFQSVFDTDEIEQILKNAYNELPQYRKNKYVTDYCLDDIEAFAEYLNAEVLR